ncbi:hypothetical protein ACFSM5_18220 [Lacibacterium aquatile]|uniref:DUF1795 domain-containing protein n=1 Tax=Lacibacterium aquatile TaxID=1168082 RepID=A0ABW5DUN8_9PROT
MLLRSSTLVCLVTLFLSSGAVAQHSLKATYGAPEPLSRDENPIKLNIQGWGTAWARNPSVINGSLENGVKSQINYSQIDQSGYFGEIMIAQTHSSITWIDDTLRKQVERHAYLSKREPEFGEYATVSNGPAEYKYIMVTVKEQNTPISCAFYSSRWRSFNSQGFLCSKPSTSALTTASTQAFLKSINFKDELISASEAVLP